MKSWYYRYAEAFADKRQYDLAEQKYEALLAWQPNDKKGILDYARMESQSLANFEKADSLLQRILGRTMYDYDALLASGDNDLDWADRVPASTRRRGWPTRPSSRGTARVTSCSSACCATSSARTRATRWNGCALLRRSGPR